MLMICASKVSEPTFSARMNTLPVPFTVAPISLSPDNFATGVGTPVVLWGGWPFFVRGWQSIQSWNLNMFTLIALGVSVAWVYSVVALLIPQIFPPIMQMEAGVVGVYFEAAAVITVLVLLGQVLELRARSRTKNGQPPHNTTGVANANSIH